VRKLPQEQQRISSLPGYDFEEEFSLAEHANEAQALSDADPSVEAGRLVSELHPWMIHRGILPE
jgi:hypothetical protein